MKQKTEIQLCISFMELLRKCPFPKITIQKIAQQCGVNRQTFYYHFDNIYDLMAKAFEYELIHESGMQEAVSWESVMRYFLCWMRDNKNIMKNILTNVEVGYLRRAIYPLVASVMASEHRFGVINKTDSEQNKEFVQHFLTLGLTQYVLEWAENDFREEVDDMISELFWLFKKIYG